MDEALVTAQKDPKLANFFYDAFLNGDLYVPVSKLGKVKGDWEQLGVTEKFQPLFLKFQNGMALPAFDTLVRLQEWAGEKPLDFIVLKGHSLLRIVAPTMSVILNLGTTFHYTLNAEILSLIRQALKPVSPS